MKKNQNIFFYLNNILYFFLTICLVTTFQQDISAAPAPVVSNVNPSSGPDIGGTPVVISGSHFTGVTAVTFGVTPALSFTFISDNTINATSPAGTGIVHVRVTSPVGTSPTGPSDQYTYILSPPTVTGVSPNSGLTSGGNTVTISGTGFNTINTMVFFGSTPASNVMIISDNTLTVTAPAGTGTVDVRVTTPSGTSPQVPADQYTYISSPAPVVTGVSPISGLASGGNTVIISGAGFNTVNTMVFFGSIAGTNVMIMSDNILTVTAPPGTGTVDIRVTTPSGTSLQVLADQYTYISSPPIFAKSNIVLAICAKYF